MNSIVTNRSRTLLAAVLIAAVSWSASAEENRVRIKAQHIYTVDGDVISPGEVLVTNGRIAFVGTSIELELPATELEVHTLIPGLVNASSNAGIAGGQAEVSREVTPDFDTLSAIDWRSRDFAEALDQGVTTVQVLPSTESVFCGFACVVKTAGTPDERIVAPDRAVVLAICSDPTSRNRSRSRPDSIYVRQPTNRMGVVWIARSNLHQARLGTAAVGLDAESREILGSVLDGRKEVISVSRADFDIRSALDLGIEFGFQPVIYGGDEIYRIMDEFAETGAKLVYTALTTNASARALRGEEGTELRWNVPGKLESVGVAFCLAGENLLDQARFAVRFGLDPQVALESITLRPAQMLDVQAQVGSIKVGKQADLVALSGDPMQTTSAVTWTMVDGKLHGNVEIKE